MAIQIPSNPWSPMTWARLGKSLLNGLAANVASIITLATELTTDYTALRVDVAALKTQFGLAATLINELKVTANAIRTDLAQSLRISVAAGAAAAADIAVSGITTSDALVAVLLEDTGVLSSNLIADASITGIGTIQLASTNTTGKVLMVVWRSAPTSAAVATADAADSAALTSTTIAAAAVTPAVTVSDDYS